MKRHAIITLTGAMLLALAGSATAEVDADAAQKLAKKNDCTKCHAADKSKKGPSYKKTAAKYKGKADGQEKVIHNITSGNKVKIKQDDGTEVEEDHKIIDTKDPKELKNIADWILSH